MTDPLPPAFVARLGEILPPGQLDGVLRSFAATKPVHVRRNPLRDDDPATTEARLRALGGEPVPWAPDGWRLPAEAREALLSEPGVADGRLYPQSAASWLPVLALDVHPGQEVLDLAAAPGGKTTHIAARLGNTGRLAAVEPVKDRFFRLKAVVERAGASCVVLYLKDGRDVGRLVPGRFDRVLLDAPCSSEARFEAGRPETWRHWSEAKIAEAARKQKALVLSAFDALRPGGRLVYATCSLAPEEDEAVLHHLLGKRPGARMVEAGVAGGPVAAGVSSWRGHIYDPSLTLARRVWPSAEHDGFFLGAVERGDSHGDSVPARTA